jgi:protein-S-isoprenylcysteine O-methyltransferase Ste14
MKINRKMLYERLRRYSQLRFAIFYPLTAYMIFFSTSDDVSLRASIVFLASGVFLRLWSNGYAIKTKKLTTSGPYAYIRNPLYLGTMLIIFGFFIMLREYWLALIFAVVMGLAYRRTVRKEEHMLEHDFKEDYRKYRKNVPAFWFRLTPYQGGEKWPFSWARLLASREHKVIVWVLIIVIAFHLKAELVVEKEKLDARMVWLIVGLVFLGGLDVFLDFFRTHLAMKKPGGSAKNR